MSSHGADSVGSVGLGSVHEVAPICVRDGDVVRGDAEHGGLIASLPPSRAGGWMHA